MPPRWGAIVVLAILVPSLLDWRNDLHRVPLPPLEHPSIVRSGWVNITHDKSLLARVSDRTVPFGLQWLAPGEVTVGDVRMYFVTTHSSRFNAKCHAELRRACARTQVQREEARRAPSRLRLEPEQLFPDRRDGLGTSPPWRACVRACVRQHAQSQHLRVWPTR